MFTTTSRKVLVPLATLVAAGAVAVGSGATFTSTSNSAITATAGTLVHANSDDTATLDITNLKPGATETGTLTITNTGSLDSTLKVVASTGSGDLAPALQIKIVSSDGASYTAGFEADHPDAGIALGDLDADLVDDSVTVTVTVTMEDSGTDSDNQYQGDTAGMSLQFVTTQTSGDESDQSGWDN